MRPQARIGTPNSSRRDDTLNRAADGERHVDARFAEVDRDPLAARGAKADNQHPFPGERGGIAITA